MTMKSYMDACNVTSGTEKYMWKKVTIPFRHLAYRPNSQGTISRVGTENSLKFQY